MHTTFSLLPPNKLLLLARFAELTAAIFLHLGVKVWLFSKICPTPWVAFGCRHYKAAAGVMVTASHNPKQDNGYKVDWDNGAQVGTGIGASGGGSDVVMEASGLGIFARWV